MVAVNQKDGEAVYNLIWIYYNKNDKRNARKCAKNILNGTLIENLTLNMKREAMKILDEIK